MAFDREMDDAAHGRRDEIDLNREWYSLHLEDYGGPRYWQIFRHGFSGASVADPRRWWYSQKAEAYAALAEFEKAVEINDALYGGK